MSKAEAQLRNIGIVAHINAGKTTLTERILFDTGKQRVMGEVDDGTATMDFLAEEQRRGISITAAVTAVGWRGYRLNLIDTPGHVDFTAEVERCLAVLDGVIVVLDGVRGVESQTETVWRQADARRAPRVVFVNKLDRTGADMAASVDSLRERLGCRPVVLSWPLFDDGGLAGLLDVASGRVESFVPPERPPPAVDPVEQARLHAAIVEVAADFDESVLADFIEERPVGVERLHAALRRGTLSGALVPVLAGAALQNRGVAQLLDAVCRYLPSPIDTGPVRSVDGATERWPRRDEPLCGLVFKGQVAAADSVALVRIYSGTLEVGETVASNDRDDLLVEALWGLHADHREPLGRALPGDVVGVETGGVLNTGDTLFVPGAPVRLEAVAFPQPVLTMAIEPRSPTDLDAVRAAAGLLSADDPTLRLAVDQETGGLLVSGMGELHLEVFGSRLSRRVGDRMRFGRPRVAYRETVAGPGEAAAECRGTGVAPPRAVVGLKVAPAWGGAHVESRVQDRMEALALLEALRERVRSGLSRPFPATDLVLTLTRVEGDPADVDGGLLYLDALDVALRKAIAQARSVVLEPSMTFEVAAPADVLSGVLADLRSRGAEIEGVTGGAGPVAVQGHVPLAAVLGYTTELRSLTRGLGTVSLRPRGFVRCRAD